MNFTSSSGRPYTLDPATAIIYEGDGPPPPAPVRLVPKPLVTDQPLQHVVLEVTQDCNQRCAYCPHTHGGVPGVRGHVPGGHMGPEVEGRVVARLWEWLDSGRLAPGATVSYYGGEPLMAPDIVQAMVERFPGLTHRIDTNGVLVTDRLARWAATRNVQWQISLDGPATVNDRYRGKGAGAAAALAVFRIRKAAPDAKITLQVTLAPPWSQTDELSWGQSITWDLVGISAVYFDRWPVGTCDLSVSLADLRGSGIPDEPLDLAPYRAAYLDACRAGRRETHPRLLRQLFEPQLIRLYHRQQGPAIQTVAGGCCDQGVRRLFIATDGTFYPCERTSGRHRIGDVWTGIDWPAVEAIHKMFHEERRALGCGACWALRLCGGCWASTGFDCDRRRAGLLADLRLYVDLLEAGAGDWLKDTTLT